MISSHQQRGELVDGSIPWPLIAFNSSWWFLMETIFKQQMLSICWNKFEDQSHVSLSALPSYFYFWVFFIPLTFDLNPGPDLSLSWCWRSSFVSSRHLQSERWSLFSSKSFPPTPCLPLTMFSIWSRLWRSCWKGRQVEWNASSFEQFPPFFGWNCCKMFPSAINWRKRETICHSTLTCEIRMRNWNGNLNLGLQTRR